MIEDGSVIAFLGLMGSGKTMGMLRLALKQHRPLYTNVPVFVPNTRIKSFSDLSELYGACVCLDELQLTVNARQFMKDTSLDFSEWLELRVRKRGSVLFYTTQDFEMVDVNVRRVTSRIYFHQKIVFRGFPASKVEVYQRSSFAQVYSVTRRFVMFHPPFYSLYLSRDEDVKLSSSDGYSDGITQETGAPGRAARSVSAGGARMVNNSFSSIRVPSIKHKE